MQFLPTLLKWLGPEIKKIYIYIYYIVEIILNFALHLCPRLRNPSLLKKMRWETTHRIQQAKIRTALKKLPRYLQVKLLRKKNAAPPSHGSLSGKRKRLQDLSEAMSGLRQVNQTLLLVMEEDEFDAFGRSLALGLKKLPLNLAVQCQNDLQATLSRYHSRAICESSLSPASTCDSGATETSLHSYNFLQQSVQTSANIAAQRENVGEENFTFSY